MDKNERGMKPSNYVQAIEGIRLDVEDLLDNNLLWLKQERS